MGDWFCCIGTGHGGPVSLEGGVDNGARLGCMVQSMVAELVWKTEATMVTARRKKMGSINNAKVIGSFSMD